MLSILCTVSIQHCVNVQQKEISLVLILFCAFFEQLYLSTQVLPLALTQGKNKDILFPFIIMVMQKRKIFTTLKVILPGTRTSDGLLLSQNDNKAVFIQAIKIPSLSTTSTEQLIIQFANRICKSITIFA